MDLEQAKFEISQKLQELKKLLEYRDIKVLWDEEQQKDLLCFNGWLTIEGLSQATRYDLYSDLEVLIRLCYFNELSEEKRILLVESIIEEIDIDDHIKAYNYDLVFEGLNEEQLETLKEFEDEQISIQRAIVEQLSIKYLNKVIFDRTKLARMIWYGNQKELAGLFYQLEKKGWVNVGVNKEAYYRTLATIFEVPGSTSLLKNIKDYLTKESVKFGVFRDLPPADIK